MFCRQQQEIVLFISIIQVMFENSAAISPLPLITVQNRPRKISMKTTEMIKKLGKRREMEILDQRSQGFWMEDQVKVSLDRIKMRTFRIKSLPETFFSISHDDEGMKKKKVTLGNGNQRRKVSNYPNSYLPQLRQMILNRDSESNRLIVAKRRKIIHLLILCLNRRNLGKLYEALDIVLLASCYFERNDQERVMKSICLNLISKIHREIKAQRLGLNRKSKLNKKRKSLAVINYLTKQNFMEDFILKLRKTKLVGEFSYIEKKTSESSSNTRKINGKCEVIVPNPSQLFDPSLQVKNYDYVVITLDDYTHSFPYEYPKSLSEIISVNDWRQMICKLNGLLFPQSKCYSFSSIIKLFYLPITLIFILMLTFSIFRTFINSQIGRLLLVIVFTVLMMVLGVKINIEESGFTNYIEIKDKMKAYMSQWEEHYKHLNLKFRMGDNIDAIFIAFPSEEPDSSVSSSKLTEIQEVDQNNTDNFSQVKDSAQKRRIGSRFEDNIMKKPGHSKFGNYDRKNIGNNGIKAEQENESVNGLQQKNMIDSPIKCQFRYSENDDNELTPYVQNRQLPQPNSTDSHRQQSNL